jgi:hypothetical protein
VTVVSDEEFSREPVRKDSALALLIAFVINYKPVLTVMPTVKDLEMI